MKIPNEDTIKERLEAAIACFMANDLHLLKTRASERAMCHKLAEHLQQVFRCWHVDCEYNRNGEIPKKLIRRGFTKDRSVLPDIIVHRRGISQNCLVIEAKCNDAYKSQVALDRKKLNVYISQLEYHYGILVTFKVRKPYGIEYEIIINEANKANAAAITQTTEPE